MWPNFSTVAAGRNETSERGYPPSSRDCFKEVARQIWIHEGVLEWKLKHIVEEEGIVLKWRGRGGPFQAPQDGSVRHGLIRLENCVWRFIGNGRFRGLAHVHGKSLEFTHSHDGLNDPADVERHQLGTLHLLHDAETGRQRRQFGCDVVLLLFRNLGNERRRRQSDMVQSRANHGVGLVMCGIVLDQPRDL